MSPLLQSLQQSGPLAISILLLLLICSVSVWTILVSRILVWEKYKSSNKDVLRIFEEEKNLFQFIEQSKLCSDGPVQRFVIQASKEIDQLKSVLINMAQKYFRPFRHMDTKSKSCFYSF